jgi:hypothetical protein
MAQTITNQYCSSGDNPWEYLANLNDIQNMTVDKS